MLTPGFDTFKFAIPNLTVSNISYSALTAYPDKKYPDKTVYHQTDIAPGLVAVRVGIVETTIEISAKILKADYPLSISKLTIYQALENTKAAAPFTFDVEEVLRLAHVLKAHQTQLLALSQPFANYADPLDKLHVSQDYDLRPYGPTSFAFIQRLNAVDLKHREYIRMYDKGEEYSRSTPSNQRFWKTLTATERQAVADYLHGKIRLESQYNTKRKLRQYFPDIHPNIMVTDLLNSTSNPLAKQFDAVTKAAYAAIDNPKQATALAYAEILDYHDSQRFDCLEKRGFDLLKVDSWLKKMSISPATQRREQKKYTALLAGYLAHDTDSESVSCLRELKAAIQNPAPFPYGYSAEASNMELTTEVSAMELATSTPRASPYSYSAEVSNMKPTATVTEPKTLPLSSVSPLTSATSYSYSAEASNMELTSEQLAAIRKEDEMFFQRLAELDTNANNIEVNTAPWLY